ncbi:hypothetical protein TNCV_4170881 [Trichonephila clavipes]|nr:hypothetical protein TNCV_4170881 [Trichonephila clavipes]
MIEVSKQIALRPFTPYVITVCLLTPSTGWDHPVRSLPPYAHTLVIRMEIELGLFLKIPCLQSVALQLAEVGKDKSTLFVLWGQW